MSPIDTGQQITTLCRRDRHRAAPRQRPHKASALQSLREQAGPLTIVPNYLQQIAASPPKAEQMTAQRVAMEDLLHLQCQRWEAFAHVRVPGRQPDAHTRWNGDH